MRNLQKYMGLGLALAFGVGNAVYAFGPSLKEEAERQKGEVLGGTLRPQSEGTASQEQQPTATAKDKKDAPKA